MTVVQLRVAEYRAAFRGTGSPRNPGRGNQRGSARGHAKAVQAAGLHVYARFPRRGRALEVACEGHRTDREHAAGIRAPGRSGRGAVAAPDQRFEVELGNGRRVHVSADFDADALKRLLVILEVA